MQTSDTSDSETSSIRRSKRQLKKQKMESSQQTQTIIQDIQDKHGYSTELPVTDTTFIGTASPRNPNELWTVDSHSNFIAEREMTVLEVEQQSDNSE